MKQSVNTRSQFAMNIYCWFFLGLALINPSAQHPLLDNHQSLHGYNHTVLPSASTKPVNRRAYPWESPDNIFEQPGHLASVHIPHSTHTDGVPHLQSSTRDTDFSDAAPRCKACVPYTGAPDQTYVPGVGGNHRIASPLPNDQIPFSITLLHTNDIHAHMDEFSTIGQDCTKEDYSARTCYGGIARIKYMVDHFRATQPHTYLFDAGDQFQGNMFYSYYKGNVTAEFMNGIGYDVFAVGNHEFDDGPNHLSKFLAMLDAPTISSNIDVSTDPDLKHLIAPYVVLTKYNARIGVIGFITNTLADIANVGPHLSFSDPALPVQRAVDELHSLGIKRIICVSHNGYEDDMDLATRTRGFDLIVGGHSHTLLHSGPVHGTKGPYPTRVVNLDGNPCYIVQAKIWGEWLGYLNIEWDEHGKLTHLNGEPIHLTLDVPQDPQYKSIVSQWRRPFDELAKTVIAHNKYELSNQPCKVGNCALGWLVANALRIGALKYLDSVELPVIGLMHEGGLRGTLPKGDLRLPTIYTVLPFSDPWTVMTVTGAWLHELLENIAAGLHMTNNRRVTAFAQFSGLRGFADKSNPPFQRVKNIFIRHQVNSTWMPMDRAASYVLVLPEFVASGGDNIVPHLVDNALGQGTLADKFVEHLQRIKVIAEHSESGFDFLPEL